MTLPLREVLISKLRVAFPQMAMQVGAENEALVVFPAKHPKVGPLVIQDEGDELTVLVGAVSHRHFCGSDLRAPVKVRAEQIAAEVTEYLHRVFADEIEFHGNRWGGGARKRTRAERGLLSKLLLGTQTYVWSGPVER